MRLSCQACSSHTRLEWHCSLQNCWHLSSRVTSFLCWTWTSHISKTIYKPRICVFVLVFKRLSIFSFSLACLLWWYLHKRKACFAKFSLYVFHNIELLCSKRPESQPESLSSKQPATEERCRLQQINPLLLLFQSARWLVLANYMSGIQGR